jgi:lysyl endopeptidase
LRGGLYRLQAGCFDAGNCSGSVAYTVTGPGGGSFSYDAANTANGTVNTRDLDISVQAGNVVTVGTCSPTAALGVQEGVPAPLTLERPAFSGDTSISLVSGATVVTNDDACGTLGSQLKFTATATGTVKLRAGCFSSTSCSGTVSYTIDRDTVFYARSNTNSGTVNTLPTNVALRVGDQITVGTCGLLGSAFTGDTVLSLFSGGPAWK